MWKIHVHVQIFSHEINLYGKFLFSVHHLYGFIGSMASLTYFKSFAFVFSYEICFIWNLSIFIFYLKKLWYEIFFFVFCIFSIQMKMISFLVSSKSSTFTWFKQNLVVLFLCKIIFWLIWRGVLESNNKPDFGNLFWGKFLVFYLSLGDVHMFWTMLLKYIQNCFLCVILVFHVENSFKRFSPTR